MANVNNLKRGMALIIDGTIYLVIEFQHVKPGKGGAFVRTKLRNAKTGAVIDKTFRGGENVEDAYLEEKVLEYLYHDGDDFVFMDHSTYEQIHLSAEVMGEAQNFLTENVEVRGRFHGDELISLKLPTTLQLKVTYTEPGFKGDTASSNAQKPATVETGATVNVPLFVNEGDIIEISTEDFSYMKRV
ncbi:elongation factor P [Candidatus Omnitrophota bacterium]